MGGGIREGSGWGIDGVSSRGNERTGIARSFCFGSFMFVELNGWHGCVRMFV